MQMVGIRLGLFLQAFDTLFQPVSQTPPTTLTYKSECPPVRLEEIVCLVKDINKHSQYEKSQYE